LHRPTLGIIPTGNIPIPTPAIALRALAERGHTAAEIERVLGLSPGYLSKVRHRAVRPSRQLIALLEVLRVHPDALSTIRRATEPAPVARPNARRGARRAIKRALEVLSEIQPELQKAEVRWALAGTAGLAAHGAELPLEAGVDIVVHDEDRHVLRLLRGLDLEVSHHASTLSICQVGATDPNEVIRVHFPETPPLSTALDRTVHLDVTGRRVPVVEGAALALGHLLSHRAGSEQAVRAAVDAQIVSIQTLRRRLDALDELPPTRSPSVLRVFDRSLARTRLAHIRRA
jgi:transcriptional regulator with XRE-family HTH domain